MYGFAAAAGKKGVARLRSLREFFAMGFLAPYFFVQSCRSLIGFNLSLLPPNRLGELRDAAAEIFEAWRAGRVRPIVGERFSFERLPDAHRALASRRTQGKIVVTVGSGLHMPH